MMFDFSNFILNIQFYVRIKHQKTIFIWKIMQIVLMKFMTSDSEFLFKIIIDQKLKLFY
jgi:hypothetical protein